MAAPFIHRPTYVLFGPPGIGKTSLIRNLSGDGIESYDLEETSLEDVLTSRIGVGTAPLVLGAAGNQPEDFHMFHYIVCICLILPNKQYYASRVRRDLQQIEKADQQWYRLEQFVNVHRHFCVANTDAVRRIVRRDTYPLNKTSATGIICSNEPVVSDIHDVDMIDVNISMMNRFVRCKPTIRVFGGPKSLTNVYSRNFRERNTLTFKLINSLIKERKISERNVFIPMHSGAPQRRYYSLEGTSGPTLYDYLVKTRIVREHPLNIIECPRSLLDQFSDKRAEIEERTSSAIIVHDRITGHDQAGAHRAIAEAYVDTCTHKDFVIHVGGHDKQASPRTWLMQPIIDTDDIMHSKSKGCHCRVGVITKCSCWLEKYVSSGCTSISVQLTNVAYYVSPENMARFLHHIWCASGVKPAVYSIMNNYYCPAGMSGECPAFVGDGVVEQLGGKDYDGYKHGYKFKRWLARGVYYINSVYPSSFYLLIMLLCFEPTVLITLLLTLVSRPIFCRPLYLNCVAICLHSFYALVCKNLVVAGVLVYHMCNVLQKPPQMLAMKARTLVDHSNTGVDVVVTEGKLCESIRKAPSVAVTVSGRLQDVPFRYIDVCGTPVASALPGKVWMSVVTAAGYAAESPSQRERTIRRCLMASVKNEGFALCDAFVDTVVLRAMKVPCRYVDIRPPYVGIAKVSIALLGAIAVGAAIVVVNPNYKEKITLVRQLSEVIPTGKPPEMFASDIRNEEVALHNRVCKKPLHEARVWNLTHEGHLVKRKVYPYSREDYANSFEGDKKARYHKAILKIEDLGLGPLVYQSFLKMELLAKDDLELSDARLIQAPPDTWKVELGRHFKAISDELIRQWRVDTPITYASKKTPHEIGVWMDIAKADFPGGLFIEVDFKRWDAHLTVPALRFEYSLYIDVFGQSVDFKWLVEQQVETVGYTKCGYRYKVQGTRKSGDPNTSVGNSLLNGLLHANIFDIMVGKGNWKIAVLGDDMIAVIKREVSHLWSEQDYTEFVNNLGLEPEIEVHEDPNKASFCSSYFYPVNYNGQDTHVLAMKAGRAVRKFGYGFGEVRDDDEAVLRGTALSMMPHGCVVPGLRTLLGRVLSHINETAVVHNHQPVDLVYNQDIKSLPNDMVLNDRGEAMVLSVYNMTSTQIDQFVLRDRATATAYLQDCE
jgi:hypothetical protein